MPSLFGALDTAVSGLSAQSAAFSNISDNIANSQTTGFKGTDTSFADYLSTSTAVTNDSGAVVARPEYNNEKQGTVSASSNPLALALDGHGWFQVSQQSGTGASSTISATTEYSRDGDFSLDDTGHLVNGSQQVLNGWMANAAGVIDKSQQVPITISQSALQPTATGNVTLAANLPAPTAYSAASPYTTAASVNVYDSKGNVHAVTLDYTQTGADTWKVALNAAGSSVPSLGTANLTFGATAAAGVTGSDATAPAGTISSVNVAGGTAGTVDGVSTLTATSAASSSAATLSFTADFGEGAQTVKLNLGNYGGTTGLTQYAGTAYVPGTLTQDGAAAGNYTGTTTQTNGDVINTYDNGQTKLVAEIPVAELANSDALQRQNGQGFTATIGSGAAVVTDLANAGGTTLSTSSVEASNVDIATEFTKLIVAQQAYGANSKVITTANAMMTQTINIIQ